MNWPTNEEMATFCQLPQGYRYEHLKRSEIPTVIEHLKVWYPGIAVGSASRYLRSEFYEEAVFLDGEAHKNVCVFTIKCGHEMVGFGSLEHDPDTLTVYAALLAIAQSHRGAKLASCGALTIEKFGRAMGAELVWAVATLKHPMSQHLMEQLGYKLIGFSPGIERELLDSGEVKRVFEAVYVKGLVADDAFLRPEPQNMTPHAKAFYDLLFPA